MHIPRYKDNNTPYPLYAGSFGLDLKFPQSDIELLANNFDALYGSWDIDWGTARDFRKINPNFNFQAYKGNWRVGKNDREFVERGKRNEVLYYLAGYLAQDVSGTDTKIAIDSLFGKILPSTAHKDSTVSYYTDDAFEYVTFLKIGDEFLRINDTLENNITVKRGFDGTEAASYPKGTPVLTTVYGRAPKAGSKRAFDFRHDERSMLRWKYMLRALINEYNRHGGGIWIDILIGNLSHYAMSGETVPPERIWDIQLNKVYDPMDRAKRAEEGIHYVQEMFYEIYAQYPIIWANNMMFPITEDNDRLRMLLSTPEKPRPIDGFAMENTFAQYGYGGHSGKMFFYASYEDWQRSIQSIMFMGELKVSANPLIMDGGIDNKKFASLPQKRRHELFMYGYASYLLAIKIEPDDNIFTKFGLCPFVFQEDGIHYVELDPCFTWNIGRPIETHPSTDYLKYQLKNRRVFVRKFENGIVLVNPSEESETAINLKMLGGPFLNPDANNKIVTKIDLNPREGMILLNQ